jgi:uncharacterized protein YbjT (DUF2867 family)
MKIIITGATGMIGKGVLLECLDHKDVNEVLSISRESTGIQHPKLKEFFHKDFSDFSSVSKQLEGYDACYACMGVSSAGMNEKKYTQLTYDFTMALAKQLYGINPNMTYTYVTGQGTDSSEKGNMMWARVKGKTENDLLKLGFKQAFVFRPGMIIPMRGTLPKAKVSRRVIKYLTWLIKFIKMIAPKAVVNTTQIGLAMIAITKKGYKNTPINPSDILLLAKES